MGYLVKIDKPNVFEMLWECWTLAWVFNERPKGRESERRADKVEDKLLDSSTEAELPSRLKCPSCGNRMTVRPSEHIEQHWKVDKTRTLKHAEHCPCPECSEDSKSEEKPQYLPAVMFFEDSEFSMLESHVDAVPPIQPKRRDKTALLDILEDAKSHWKGSEVDMRKKLNPPTAETEAAAESPTAKDDEEVRK